MFVQIETADHSSAAWLEAFAKGVGEMPEVMELYRMAGDVDYMLRVVVSDMAAYDGFYKRLIDRFPLKNVTSRFAMAHQVGDGLQAAGGLIRRGAAPGCIRRPPPRRWRRGRGVRQPTVTRCAARCSRPSSSRQTKVSVAVRSSRTKKAR